MIVRCVGVPDRRRPGSVILKITEPSDLRGKVAFPVGFSPLIGEEYLCEVIHDAGRWCRVTLHRHDFSRRADCVVVSASPGLATVKLYITVHYVRECRRCGRTDRDAEEFAREFPASERGLREAEEWLREVVPPEALAEALEQLRGEFTRALSVVVATERDIDELAERYADEVERLAREARFPWWRVEERDSGAGVEVRAALLGEGGAPLFEVSFVRAHSGHLMKLRVRPQDRERVLLFLALSRAIPVPREFADEFERAMRERDYVSLEEREVSEVFRAWLSEYERRGEVVLFSARLRVSWTETVEARVAYTGKGRWMTVPKTVQRTEAVEVVLPLPPERVRLAVQKLVSVQRTVHEVDWGWCEDREASVEVVEVRAVRASVKEVDKKVRELARGITIPLARGARRLAISYQ